MELGADNYKQWEWFCRDFADNGEAYRASVRHLDSIRAELAAGVLYRLYDPDGNLLEYPMESLPPWIPSES